VIELAKSVASSVSLKKIAGKDFLVLEMSLGFGFRFDLYEIPMKQTKRRLANCLVG